MTEADLVRQARQGDVPAWETLTRDHQQPVFRLAYLLLGDSDDAEDAAQETFIRAWFALRRFDLTRPLRPWLLGIASNLIRNKKRSAARYFAHLMRAARAEPVSTSAPELDESQELWKAIQRLKPEFQEVLYLRYFLEMSESEMAQTLNVAAGTVKSRLHRALNALREIVAADFPHLKDDLV